MAPYSVPIVDKIKFTGRNQPSMPINWRLAESVSALKGLEAVLLNILLGRKSGLAPQEISIGTDHAHLFVTSFFSPTNKPEPSGWAYPHD